MKKGIAIVMVLCCWSAAQIALRAQEKPGVVPSVELLKGVFPSSNEVLVGSVVQYDGFLSSHSPEADMLVRLKLDESKYVRILYSPHDFGFDAPPATESQLLPKEMFSDGNLVWTFQVHYPRNPAEESACTSVRKVLKPLATGKEGQFVEIERYKPVPGTESEHAPQPESLRCLILETWAKKPDSIAAGHAGIRFHIESAVMR